MPGRTSIHTLALALALASPGSSAQSGTTGVVVIPIGGDARPDNLVIVAKANGDFDDPVAALDSITDAGVSNTYRVFIEPGTYDVSSGLAMQPHVDVIGSGIDNTTIQGPVSSTSVGPASALVVLADNSTISHLKLINQGTVSRSIGAYIPSGVTAALADVYVRGEGGQWNYGIVNDGTVDIDNVIAEAEDFTSILGSFSYGLLDNSGATVSNSVISAISGNKNYGVYTASGVTTNVETSLLTGTGFIGDEQAFGAVASFGTLNLDRVHASGAGGSGSNAGAMVNFAGTINVVRSVLTASGGFNQSGLNCLDINGSCEFNVDFSSLPGTPVANGTGTSTFNCTFSDDGAGTALNADCEAP